MHYHSHLSIENNVTLSTPGIFGRPLVNGIPPHFLFVSSIIQFGGAEQRASDVLFEYYSSSTGWNSAHQPRC